ncbi:uncharacterized protein [Elaeis guineensis]|uniref:uncharacterized protein isoform X1 n=1 Tax=Elaeis guineensis var. tenera TaxID=51953 RepID=UPI003C6D5F69
MVTSSKPAFEGQSLEKFFASFAYKGGGGGHGDGIRKRNSRGGGSVDKKIGQRRLLLSPNNNNNNTPPPPPPPPPPSSSLQSTTNRKETTITKPPSILNGLSPVEFIASFSYKGKRRVDNRIGKAEDLLNPGTPPPPPPVVKYRKGRKTAAAATTTTVRRVSRFFPPPAGNFIVVDGKKDITEKGKARSGGGTTRKRPRTTGNTGSTDANRQPQKRSKGRRKQRSIQLSAEEKFSDAYKRVSDHDIWDAPRSSHNLLQERHCFDPWRVLVICILLNKTNGNQVRNVLPGFFLLCPNAESALKEGVKEQIVGKLWSLGLQWKRAGLIVKFSRYYLAGDWTHVTQLPGIGKYAADAYAIFAAGKLQQVKPQDHKLVEYWKEVGRDVIQK